MMASVARADRIAAALRKLPIDKTDKAEPMLPIEQNDPTLPTERTDPTLPIESTELREAMDRTDPVDRSGVCAVGGVIWTSSPTLQAIRAPQTIRHVGGEIP